MINRRHNAADHSHSPDVFNTTDACAVAVKRTYDELCGDGQPDHYALEAALTVFNWYHPEITANNALAIVSGWLRSQQPQSVH